MAIWGAIASVAGALLGGSSSSKASKQQANAAEEAGRYQLQAAQESIAEQRRQYDLSRSDSAPWRNAGASALDAQRAMLFGAPPNPYGQFTGQPTTSYNDRFAGGSQTFDETGGGGNYVDSLAGGNTYDNNTGQLYDPYGASTAEGPNATGAYTFSPDRWGGPRWGATDNWAGPAPTQQQNDYYGTLNSQLEGSYTPQRPQGEQGTQIDDYINQFVDPQQQEAFRALPISEQMKYVQQGGDTTPVDNPNMPSNSFQDTVLPGRDYADFDGPAARGGPGIMKPANLPDVISGNLNQPNLPGGYNPTDVVNNPNISSEVGVNGPEFTNADTSFDAFKNSPNYQAMLFQQQEFLRAQAAGRSAQGNLYSGAAGRELSRYAEGVANQNYGDFYNQATETNFNRNNRAYQSYGANLDLSREGYGREMDQFGVQRALYGDAVGREKDIYSAGQTDYQNREGQFDKQYDASQLEWQQKSQQADYRYQQALAEQNRQFDAEGILRNEAYGEATDTYKRGVQDWGYDYQNAVDQYNLDKGEYDDYYARLSGMSGTGANATANLGALGAGMVNATGNTRMGAASDYGNSLYAAGTIGAAGTMGTANAWQQGLSGLGNYFASLSRPPSNPTDSAINWAASGAKY